MAAIPAWCEETVLEVLTLRYRTADEILPVIRPFVERQGTVSGMNNRLIVRTTPANLAELHRLLADLDRAPRRLMITVRQSSDRREEGSGAAIEYRPGRESLRAKVYGTQSMDSGGETHQVQVLEGKSAYIQVGQMVPVPQHQTVISGGKAIVYDTTVYQDATRGFYVLPRVNGDAVTLEINPQSNTPGTRPGEVNLQQISTVVSGRLGEWLEVGGVDQQRSEEGSGTVYTTRDLSADRRRVLLKVEELP